MLAGTLLYPLGRTIIERFDGSAPFFHRLRAPTPPSGPATCAASWSAAARALAILLDLPHARRLVPLPVGALIGASPMPASISCATCAPSAPASANTCRPGGSMPSVPCSGGSPAGAVAWYLDTAQVAVVAAKLAPTPFVRPRPDYIVYPLFSKWGALSLGPAEGGVRLSSTNRCPA